MNKTLLGLSGTHILFILVVVLVLGGAFFIKDNPLKEVVGIYCSDGELSDTMPIQSHRSYCLKSDAENKRYSVNNPNLYSFSIVDDQSNPVKDFAITHTKLMHVIVVRKDLAHFQHVHPEFNEITAVFTLSNLIFPADGDYRIFADFAPLGAMMDPDGVPLVVTISEDVKVGDNYNQKLLGSEENKKTFDGIEFTLNPTPTPLRAGQESMLTFDLKSNGKAVTDMETYLGALGHSVVLREGSLDFIHVHPMERVTPHGTLEFMVTFPAAGKYKVFTQFQRNGKIITTDFVVSVAKGSGVPMMPGLDH